MSNENNPYYDEQCPSTKALLDADPNGVVVFPAPIQVPPPPVAIAQTEATQKALTLRNEAMANPLVKIDGAVSPLKAHGFIPDRSTVPSLSAARRQAILQKVERQAAEEYWNGLSMWQRFLRRLINFLSKGLHS